MDWPTWNGGMISQEEIDLIMADDLDLAEPLDLEWEPQDPPGTYRRPYDNVLCNEVTGLPIEDYVDFSNTKIKDTI